MKAIVVTDRAAGTCTEVSGRQRARRIAGTFCRGAPLEGLYSRIVS
jgi:hypothetical protein